MTDQAARGRVRRKILLARSDDEVLRLFDDAFEHFSDEESEAILEQRRKNWDAKIEAVEQVVAQAIDEHSKQGGARKANKWLLEQMRTIQRILENAYPPKRLTARDDRA